jgi:hypothetical protein
MRTNTIGSQNTSLGRNALYSNVNGHYNTAVGHEALESNVEGQDNIAIGRSALNMNTIGHYNTAVGCYALDVIIGADYNTGLGYDANNSVSVPNTTGIGYFAQCASPNQVRLGNASVTSIGGHANWSNISDGRFKYNIEEDVEGLAFIQALRPVTYQVDLLAINNWWGENYNKRDAALEELGIEKSKIRYTGFIAQEVEAAAQALGYDFSGVDGPKNEKDFYGLRYAEFVVPLVKAVQELSEENANLKLKMELMLKENEKLNSEISNLKHLNLRVEALENLMSSHEN